MRIYPIIANTFHPKFTASEDIRKTLSEAFSQGLNMSPESDTFTPSSPTKPPIIIETLVIKNGDNDKDKSSKVSDTLTGVGLGGLGTAGASEVVKGKGKSDDNQEKSSVDYEKLADKAAAETRNDNTDSVDSETDVNDDYEETEYNNDVADDSDSDSDSDFDDDGE